MKHDRHMWNNLFSTYDRQRCMNNTHEHQISSNWEIWQGARLCDGMENIQRWSTKTLTQSKEGHVIKSQSNDSGSTCKNQ